VERLARALPGLGVGVLRRHLALLRSPACGTEHSSTSGIQHDPHGETPTGGAGGRNDRTRRRAVALGAALFGGTPHGGGPGAGSLRPENGTPRCKDGVADGASISRMTPERPKSQPSARSLERGEDGAPLISAKPHSGRPRPTAASRIKPALEWREERPERKGLRQRLTRSGRGSCQRAAAAHPRERLVWRGMCRGVRGTSAPEQMT
jgi:hypothetical protein